MIAQVVATVAVSDSADELRTPAQLFAAVEAGRAHVILWEVCDEGPNKQPGLGDIVAAGLDAVGITKERVQAVASAVGVKDCGCKKRQEKLNELGRKFGIG